jgi:serine/threonine protein kinase
MPHSPFDSEFLAQQLPDLTSITYITSGGQKSVYSAHHRTLGKVALKILTPGASTERFEREIAAVQKIQIPHIPPIHRHGQLAPPHSDHLWLQEQWLDGINLRERLRTGPLSNQLILTIGLNVLEVLAMAETYKIVHRDIKPENILVAHNESRSWLIDFGIARHLDMTSLTADFMPCTLSYAPIEQLNGLRHEIDSRSDLFSLGVTLYECVVGVNPFLAGAASNQEIFDRMLTMPLPELPRDIDQHGQFKDLVSAMSQQHRNHRLESAADAYEWMKEIAAAGPA